MTTPDMDAVLQAVGPLDDGILAVVRAADDRWAVRFEDVDVEVEFDEATGRLMASAVIGRPPPERAAKLHEMLLVYGMIWRDTGGVRMALTGPGGEAVQMADLYAPQVTPEALVVLVVNLAERTRVWRGLFAADAEDAATPSFDSFDATLIRA